MKTYYELMSFLAMPTSTMKVAQHGLAQARHSVPSSRLSCSGESSIVKCQMLTTLMLYNEARLKKSIDKVAV